MTPAAQRLLAYLEAWARGRGNAVPLRVLAGHLETSTRSVQELAAELVEEGHLIGSSAVPGRAGLFVIEDMADLEIGTAWVRHRALTTLRRVSLLKKAAGERFGVRAERLFDLSEEAS